MQMQRGILVQLSIYSGKEEKSQKSVEVVGHRTCCLRTDFFPAVRHSNTRTLEEVLECAESCSQYLLFTLCMLCKYIIF
jgi:hypothetical protein